MEYSTQHLATISVPNIGAIAAPCSPQPIDWTALNAVREQRVALQTEILERRISVIMERILNRETAIAALNLPSAPLPEEWINILANSRAMAKCITAPEDGTARQVIEMIFASMAGLNIARQIAVKDDSGELLSRVSQATSDFSSELYAELDTIKLMSVELCVWRALAREPECAYHPFLMTEKKFSQGFLGIESERWAFEDGNVDLVLSARDRRYRLYKIMLESELSYMSDTYTSEGLRDLSELLTRVEAAYDTLRDHNYFLNSYRMRVV